jgi:uncharacterized protein YjbJ (UPF0337 family)
MDKDRAEGAINDAAGRAKRQIGEWTGDIGTQVEGSAQQLKGKAEKFWGNVKEAVHNVKYEAQLKLENSKSDHPVSGRP